MTIKLIVGLANPGEKYAKTRHNAGAWYIHALAKRLYASPFRKEPKFYGIISNIEISNIHIKFLIPTTFMNLSGTAVELVTKFYKIKQEEILIAHDELNLFPGIAKFKFGGGHGGHNGLKNIIKKLGNNKNFYRLRIGIRNLGDKTKIIDLVLNQAPPLEKKRIDEAINEAVICTEIWFKQGFIAAINRLNAFKAK